MDAVRESEYGHSVAPVSFPHCCEEAIFYTLLMHGVRPESMVTPLPTLTCFSSQASRVQMLNGRWLRTKTLPPVAVETPRLIRSQSSQYTYLKDDRRAYHCHTDGKYVFPDEQQELNHLDLQYHTILKALDERDTFRWQARRAPTQWHDVRMDLEQVEHNLNIIHLTSWNMARAFLSSRAKSASPYFLFF